MCNACRKESRFCPQAWTTYRSGTDAVPISLPYHALPKRPAFTRAAWGPTCAWMAELVHLRYLPHRSRLPAVLPHQLPAQVLRGQTTRRGWLPGAERATRAPARRRAWAGLGSGLWRCSAGAGCPASTPWPWQRPAPPAADTSPGQEVMPSSSRQAGITVQTVKNNRRLQRAGSNEEPKCMHAGRQTAVLCSHMRQCCPPPPKKTHL